MTEARIKARIYGVVVVYRPDISVLRALLEALRVQVERVVVVDNTPRDDASYAEAGLEYDREFLHVIRLGLNTGVAHALNVGINSALDAGATHVLLSDQDSLPAPDMALQLLLAFESLRSSGAKVGAVGPVYSDRHLNVTFPFQVEVPGRLFYGHAQPGPSLPYIEVLTLITSGTLLSSDVFREVGQMRTDLFIDYVDIEWNHRARALGYRLYGVRDAKMFQSMGDHAIQVWYFGWHLESAYSPIRAYYRTRNLIALCRDSRIRARWKVRSAWNCLGFVYSQCLFGKSKLATLRMVLRGVLDGLRGRMGAFV